MRSSILTLVTVLGLVASSCADDAGLDLSAISDDLSNQDEPAISGDDASPDEDSQPIQDAPDVDDGPDDDPPVKEPLESDAKDGSATLSSFFEGGVSTASEQCMVEGLLADPDLLGAVIAAGPTAEISEMSVDDQVAAVSLGLSCITTEELSESIQANFDADLASDSLAGDAADCVSSRLTDRANPGRSQLLLAFVAVGEDRPPTREQGDLLVALMVDCIDPAFLVDATLASVVDDPLLATALDRGCLDAAVGNDAYLEQFWELFVANADVEFEELPPAQQATIIGPFLECISFGTVIAASAAEDGVELSSESIACIDDALDTGALIDAFVTGVDFDETRLIGAVLPCLSLEELGSLG